MPIHLPPWSRRSFLRRCARTATLAAGAGVLAHAHWLAAAARDPSAQSLDPNSWALLADTHIDADPSKVHQAVNMTDHLSIVSKELLALAQLPAGVFVVGDCAFSKGEPGDYSQFAGLIEPLRAGGLPLHLALGNHDHRDHFWAALEAERTAKRPVTDKQVALIKAELVNWFLLDSLEKTSQTPGALGGDQLRWLAETLDANAKKPAVIVVHHNPGLDGNFGLKDTEALMEVLRPRKQAKAWVYGHTHNWKVAQDESGVHLVNLPPVAYIFREGDPSGWVQATARADGMKLELRCVDRQHANHGQVVDLKWREA